MAAIAGGSSGGKPKKRPAKSPGTKPVKVYETKAAKKAKVPVQRAVHNVNHAVGAKVVKKTNNKKKANIVVHPGVSPKNKEFAQAYASRIPKNRKQIDSRKTDIRVSGKSYKKELYKGMKAGKGGVKPSTNVTTHELGHALGLTHHEKLTMKKAKPMLKWLDEHPDKTPPKRLQKNAATRSIMSGGTKFTGYDKKTIQRVVGLAKERKAGQPGGKKKAR